MKTHRTLLAAGLATALAANLSGCAVPTPSARAEAPAPTQWHAPRPAGDTLPPLPHNGDLATLTQWWRQFNDPLLVELIEAAQAASPTIASARSRIEQARATRVAASAALLPTLDAQAAAQRGNTQLPGTTASSAQVGLQTAWEIDLFGANRYAGDAAQARLEGAQASWHEARVAVAAETGNQYFSLRTCEKQLAVARNDAASRAETARLADLSAKAGFTAPASAALARASAAEGSARATQQRAQCEVDLKVLVALTGLDEPGLRGKLATTPAVIPQSALHSVASIPAQALMQRPDLYQAGRELAAASAEVGSTRAQRLPRLTLSGSVAAGSVRSGGVSNDAQTWSIGPLALTLPLFDGGRRAANVDAAQARYTEAVALYQARARQAVREVEEALVQLDSSASRGEDARVAAEGYRASFTGTEARYKGGLASLVELEDARRTALAAETALVGLQRERMAAWIALYRAAGGGWMPPTASALAEQKP
jgi:multidrug efflux system outer membrane protein